MPNKPSPWSFDFGPLERELRLNIEWSDSSGYWHIYAYDKDADRFAEELGVNSTVEQIGQAAHRVAADRDAKMIEHAVTASLGAGVSAHHVPIGEIGKYARDCLSQALAADSIASPYDVRREQLLAQGVISLQCEHARLRTALEQSVRLQSHYAFLLNLHDGGERLQFENADAWLRRLAEVCDEETERK